MYAHQIIVTFDCPVGYRMLTSTLRVRKKDRAPFEQAADPNQLRSRHQVTQNQLQNGRDIAAAFCSTLPLGGGSDGVLLVLLAEGWN